MDRHPTVRTNARTKKKDVGWSNTAIMVVALKSNGAECFKAQENGALKLMCTYFQARRSHIDLAEQVQDTYFQRIHLVIFGLCNFRR